MAQTQRERIQELLTQDPSPQRAALLRLGFDALAGQPLSALLNDPELLSLLTKALTRDNAQRIAERHVLTGIARAAETLQGRDERVKDALPGDAQTELLSLIQSGKGPSFAWLSGAIDPADLRQLFAPVVQQVLSQFVNKLPIPGVGGGGAGGLVGMLGKGLSRGASQLADVGKSVIGGLSSELSSRMNSATKDFSQSAIGEFRTAIAERLKSDEGKEIVSRIRAGVLARVLDTQLAVIAEDFLRVPAERVASIVVSTIDHQRSQALFTALVEGELKAALSEVGARSLSALLEEAGILDEARAFSIRAVEPGLKKLVASQEFGAWLDGVLADSQTP